MTDAELAVALAALGQPIRLELYRLLVTAGLGGAGPGVLAEMAGLERNLVSYHLRPLVAGRLVTNERRGRDVIYRVDHAGLARLAAAMLKLADSDCRTSN